MNISSIKTIKDFVGSNPFYIEIFHGAKTFRKILIEQNTLIIPIGSIGNEQNIAYGTEVLNELGISTNQNFKNTATNEGRLFHTCSAVVYRNLSKNEINKCIDNSFIKNEKIKTLLSIYTAGSLHKLIKIVKLHDGSSSAEFLPPTAKNGVSERLDDEPFSDSFLKLCTKSHIKNDELMYRLSLLEQANSTDNELYRIASYFSILESLASPITSQFIQQTGDNKKRAAIRYLLGYYKDQHTPKFTLGNSDIYEFDHIELAGKVRDKIFHGGGSLREKDVNHSLKTGVNLLNLRPDMICHALRRDCESAIASYTLRQGLGFKAKNGFKVKYSPPDPNYNPDDLPRLCVDSSIAKGSSIGSVFVKFDGLEPNALQIRVTPPETKTNGPDYH